MSKIASIQYPVADFISERWSPRSFSGQSVTPDLLRIVLEAARWAASSSNQQPWRIIVARKEETAAWQTLFNCLVEANQKWAKDAPVLMLTVAKVVDTKGRPNRYAMHDVGLATAGMQAQAISLGLYLHLMGGYEVEKARTAFAIPEGFEPCAAIAMGYLGEPEQLEEPYKEREVTPRERMDQNEFVFGSTWAEAWQP